MVGIVIVSHSARLAGGIIELARQMAGPEVPIAAAGGLDQPGQPLGTDAMLVARSVDEAWSDDGVLVLMDLGSAVMSAEMALDMVAEERRGRVLLCDAPVVEGAVAAAVAARLGEPLDRVAAEARGGLAGKAAHLSAAPGAGTPAAGTPAADGPPAAGPAAGQPAGATGDSTALEARLTVANRLGLHARPAARFVETAGEFEATVTAENLTAGRGPASARSLNGVATLGVRQGHEILVRATGPQAGEALQAIRQLAARNFDEPVTAAQPSATGTPAPSPAAPLSVPGAEPAGAAPSAGPPPATPPPPGTVLSGIAVSPGVVPGKTRHLRPAPIEVPREPAAGPGAELARLSSAVEATRREVRQARDSVSARTGAAYETAIFDAHLLFLADEALLGPARRMIGEGRNAADAWDRAVADVAAAWQGLEDPYQRGRVRDLESIRAQVLAHLTGGRRSAVSGPGIVVAADLTPADTASLDPAIVTGVATAFGGPTSHAAILARALGIPAAVGFGPDLLAVPEATPLLLDADAGTIRVAPAAAEIEAARRAASRRRAAAGRARRLAAEPAVTADGTRVEVAANAGSVDDARRAVAAGADGIGLLRTEFVFLSAAAMPTEQDQEAVYREIAGILDGRPLIVRTLDVGADKPLPYLPREPEPNPALGQRGLRLGLARTSLLLPQIRAVLKVAAGHPVKLMFPMVATGAELGAALALVEEARRGLRAEGVAVPGAGAVEVGIMVEVPAAALAATALAAAAGFFSVGTNDLTQYTLAADRDVAAVAGLADAMHPAVLALIGRAAAAATRAGRWIGVCGELAADPLAVPLLLGLGVRELSVDPAAVADVKQAVRQVDLAGAAELAARAIGMPSAGAVRELARSASR
ncbi:MAG TPA: phosphoenolpyruvate--protein phosphotransferase [Streptosporangiaceae bacterium]|nr:phosphoenolpyruvate--protein phosphotransferase [Streptosporangiaceae bacterium]